MPVRLAELFLEAGLPAGVFQVVHGDKEAVDAILEHPEIKAVGFVGSSDIAQYIYSTAAANGKRAQCFGGAKNHMIVMPDADLDQAVDALIGAGYGSAGERCMAISVAVPVGEQTADRLRARLIERVNQLRVGHSLDPKADYGPLVTEAALKRVHDYIDQGVEAGAEAVVDGRERTSDDLQFGDANLEGGYFIGPTLFDHVTPDMSIYTDEIFGPVLCIVRAKDYEEALRLPSEHEYGNGVAIFTRDGDTARDFVSRVQVGMVGVNVPIPVPVAYHTFGGWKRSGFGDLNQHGPASIQFYTKAKTVTQRWPSGIARRRVRHPDNEVANVAVLRSGRRRTRDRRDGGRVRREAARAICVGMGSAHHFPTDVLREAAELGMAAIYCREDAGGSGLRRIDAVRIFEQLAVADPTVAAFLSIHNMCAWMVDTLRHPRTTQVVGAEARVDGGHRQLLPDRTGCGIGRRGAAHQGRPRRRRLRDRRGQAVHLRRGHIRRLHRDGPHRRRGAARHLGVHRRKGHAGAEFRRRRAEDGLERAAHRAGDLRGRPGARRRDARRRGRRGHRLRHRDERAQRRPDQHRRVLARRSAGRLRQGGELPGRPPGVRRALLDEPTIRFTLADMATALETSRTLLWRAATRSTTTTPTRWSCARWPSATSPTPASTWPIRRCSCTAATAICASTGWRRSSAICGCTESSRGTNEIMRVVIGRAEAARARVAPRKAR